MQGTIDPPRLETPRLLLRGHVLDDFDASATMWSDPAVTKYIADGNPSTTEESWSRFLKFRGHWHLLGYGYWVVEDKSTGTFIGEVGFADHRREMEPSLEGRPEAGWALKTTAHGQGFATEAVRRIMEWADAVLEVPRTVCTFDPQHAASIRVAQKIGYVEIIRTSYRGRPLLVMERSRSDQKVRRLND